MRTRREVGRVRRILLRGRGVTLAVRSDVPCRFPWVSRTDKIFHNLPSGFFVASTLLEWTADVFIAPSHNLVYDPVTDKLRHGRCRQNDVDADECDNENLEERGFHRHISLRLERRVSVAPHQSP